MGLSSIFGGLGRYIPAPIRNIIAPLDPDAVRRIELLLRDWPDGRFGEMQQAREKHFFPSENPMVVSPDGTLSQIDRLELTSREQAEIVRRILLRYGYDAEIREQNWGMFREHFRDDRRVYFIGIHNAAQILRIFVKHPAEEAHRMMPSFTQYRT